MTICGIGGGVECTSGWYSIINQSTKWMCGSLQHGDNLWCCKNLLLYVLRYMTALPRIPAHHWYYKNLRYMTALPRQPAHHWCYNNLLLYYLWYMTVLPSNLPITDAARTCYSTTCDTWLHKPRNHTLTDAARTSSITSDTWPVFHGNHPITNAARTCCSTTCDT